MQPQILMWETHCQKAEITTTETIIVITAHFCNVLTLNLGTLSSQPYQFKQCKIFTVEQNLPLGKGYKKNIVIKPTWTPTIEGRLSLALSGGVTGILRLSQKLKSIIKWR